MVNKRDYRLLSNYRIERESKYTNLNTANGVSYIFKMISPKYLILLITFRDSLVIA